MCCLDLPHNRPQRFIPLTRSHETTCRLLSLYFAVSLNFTTTTTKQGHFGLSYARITQVVVSNLLVHSGYCLLVVRGKGRGGGGQVRPGPPPPQVLLYCGRGSLLVKRNVAALLNGSRSRVHDPGTKLWSVRAQLTVWLAIITW